MTNKPRSYGLLKLRSVNTDDDQNIGRKEFHISRESRHKYQFDHHLFSIRGNVIIANFYAARQLAEKLNQKRDIIRQPELAARPSEVNAMGLIDEILHYMVELYYNEFGEKLRADLTQHLHQSLGQSHVEKTLVRFVNDFPPRPVYTNKLTPQQYLENEGGKISNKDIALEELVMLWLDNGNTAYKKYHELFDDTTLTQDTSYQQIIAEVRKFFALKPLFEGLTLIDLLRAPALAHPDSIEDQLRFIQARWGKRLGRWMSRLLGSLDLIAEENRALALAATGGFFKGPAEVLEYGGAGDLEVEAFSPDTPWMPRVVMLAKSTYVWLDQLSKKYQRHISRLDQIPDEELDLIARQGFSAVWLIGLWERSKASKRIKQIMGNPEAEASAYSLKRYEIAEDIGGQQAYDNLRGRAWQRKIRLASDMVPNHMGVDSDWVMENPDYFLSLENPPYPAYSFGNKGPNLSEDPSVGIFLEDHYYDRSDAAVVFQRVDYRSGHVRYIYHGNDGTSMPWNDTAQLNYLKPEVREAVIQNILHVARMFPIIRFDAAMTLAKKHIQRLWFPQPGSGEGIPSRSEYGLSKQEFDQLMPKEFWREVVDRVAEEVPDTLLLAEAFWLLEGYFVRTLGMHRVYNSAFMNMLKDEENSKFRLTIKNTIEFDPQILKRFVNFMNNPDEETAVVQFGKGDKYFGICTMLVTLPGLPMFGHGQIEGYAEKYGMEYRRAYWDEHPDESLVRRHEREIFPLMKKRHIYAEVDNFLLYDFYLESGQVNEDVFVFSNSIGDQRSLVIYHNKYARTSGWIKTSAGYLDKEKRQIVQKTLGEGIVLPNDQNQFLIFRDHFTNLWYIRNCHIIYEDGMFVELGAYKYYVLLDFYTVEDNAQRDFSRLSEMLHGQGVTDINQAIMDMHLQPIHSALRELAHPGMVSYVVDQVPPNTHASIRPEMMGELEGKLERFYSEARNFLESRGKPESIAKGILGDVHAVLTLPPLLSELKKGAHRSDRRSLVDELGKNLADERKVLATLVLWCVVKELGQLTTTVGNYKAGSSLIDEWRLAGSFEATFKTTGVHEWEVSHYKTLVKLLVSHSEWISYILESEQDARRFVNDLFTDFDFHTYVSLNRHNGTLWFNKESFEELLSWFFLIGVVSASKKEKSNTVDFPTIHHLFVFVGHLKTLAERASYKVEEFLDLVGTASLSRRPKEVQQMMAPTTTPSPIVKPPEGGLGSARGDHRTLRTRSVRSGVLSKEVVTKTNEPSDKHPKKSTAKRSSRRKTSSRRKKRPPKE